MLIVQTPKYDQIFTKKTYNSIFDWLLRWSPFRSGVSNTRPAGRMWPAWRVYAARFVIKFPLIIDKNTVLWGTRVLFIFYCAPQRHFLLLVRPASSFFIKMLPAYTFEFETPELDIIKIHISVFVCWKV